MIAVLTNLIEAKTPNVFKMGKVWVQFVLSTEPNMIWTDESWHKLDSWQQHIWSSAKNTRLKRRPFKTLHLIVMIENYAVSTSSFFFSFLFFFFFFSPMHFLLKSDIFRKCFTLLCLAICKLFFEYKIFLSENIFEKGKYFLVFGYILKIVLENIFWCLVTF